MASASNSDDLGYHLSSSSIDLVDLTSAQSPMSGYSFPYCRTNSEMSGFSIDDNSYGSSEPSPSCWPYSELGTLNPGRRNKQRIREYKNDDGDKFGDQEQADSARELEMAGKRFAKLLLGEDKSGRGKGVCTALTISNAITNLYAPVFGQTLRLEPLNSEKKAMWRREMDCLLSVCDYIVELYPEPTDFGDGITVEVMTNRPRSDIYTNLPALQKLDSMLLEILDSFEDTEFWYAETGSVSSNSTRSASATSSFRWISLPKEEKWWQPVPCIPHGGLSDKARKQLRNKRDFSNQIHKAAKAINCAVLADMEIPDSYLENLPKSGRASLGDVIYRVMFNSEKFVPENLLGGLNIESEYEALEFADRVEASMYTWRRKACLSYSRSSWDSVKDLVAETDRTDKNTVLAERAESLLLSLKQKFPQLSQTALDTCKIQFNKDVGKAILESYSRVLEGLAFNITAWIEEVLFAERSMRPCA